MPDAWMPQGKWDALVRGEGCPLCAELTKKEDSDEYGYNVADLQLSRLRLNKNQYVKGYCVLICHKHVREPYELSRGERGKYFDDMCKSGQVLEKVFRADKMNFQILGNAVPHLHCHIIPRYLDDPAPHRPIDPNAGEVILKPEEYRNLIKDIRQVLSSL
jgi:diadenosine tetraphosphate (Ap4A) HIT family hydrolase